MALYYADYLKLSELLNAQQLESTRLGTTAHDEHLFIVTHQAYELWFKQILWELGSIHKIFSQAQVSESSMSTVVSRMARVKAIQSLLIDQIAVLETMAPQDFLEFRNLLSPASGFQSVQFRILENTLGLRQGERLSPDKSPYYSRLSKDDQQRVQKSEEGPSLLQLVDQWLQRTPFLKIGGFDFWAQYQKAAGDMLAEDRKIIEANATLSSEGKAHQLKQLEGTEAQFKMLLDETTHQQLVADGAWKLSFKGTQAALLIHLYRELPALQMPYEFLKLLVDSDEMWTVWRQRHMQMASRMIGSKIGTGGSSGAKYLGQAAEKHKVFSDLEKLATFLLPRSKIPKLPKEVEKLLRFSFETEA
jgi:tryptophan 2,3-dioxygenase